MTLLTFQYIDQNQIFIRLLQMAFTLLQYRSKPIRHNVHTTLHKNCSLKYIYRLSFRIEDNKTDWGWSSFRPETLSLYRPTCYYRYVFLRFFFKIQKNVTFYVFLLCFIRFLELWYRVVPQTQCRLRTSEQRYFMAAWCSG